MLIYFQDDLLYSLYSTAQYWDYETRWPRASMMDFVWL